MARITKKQVKDTDNKAQAYAEARIVEVFGVGFAKMPNRTIQGFAAQMYYEIVYKYLIHSLCNAEIVGKATMTDGAREELDDLLFFYRDCISDMKDNNDSNRALENAIIFDLLKAKKAQAA